jgi:16S rRNA (cytidine1402-2'-O)-methyltransferase
VGYLPQDAAARAQAIRALEQSSQRSGQTQLMIETPYRNAALLQALLQHLQAQTRLCVASALSLPQESVRTDTVQGWRASGTPAPKGPCIFLFGV